VVREGFFPEPHLGDGKLYLATASVHDLRPLCSALLWTTHFHPFFCSAFCTDFCLSGNAYVKYIAVLCCIYCEIQNFAQLFILTLCFKICPCHLLLIRPFDGSTLFSSHTCSYRCDGRVKTVYLLRRKTIVKL
jgi:hypothetical protein